MTTQTSVFTEHNTPTHVQWASQAVLHVWQTMREDQLKFTTSHFIAIQNFSWNIAPLDAALKLSLTWSIVLGSPVEEEVLKVRDKTHVIFNLSLQIGCLCR